MTNWLWARIEERFSRIKAKFSNDKAEVDNVQTQTQGIIAHTIEQPTYSADSTDNDTIVSRFTASGKVTDKDAIIYDFTAPGNGNVYGFSDNIWELFKITSQENTDTNILVNKIIIHAI
jgi:hypothetical protein